MTEGQLTVFGVGELELSVDDLLKNVSDRGNSNIYIHLDLNVLDPAHFPHVPLPSPGGLKNSTVEISISLIKARSCISAGSFFVDFKASKAPA